MGECRMGNLSLKEEEMRGIKWTLLLALGIVLVVGCGNTKETFTLNPDGSGRVAVEATFQLINMGNEDSDPKADVRQAVKKTLEESKGIDAWKDVSATRDDEGNVVFKGTAYFPDISKIKFTFGGTKLESAYSVSRDADNNMVLEIKVDKDKKKPATKKLSEEELENELKKAKAKYKQQKPMFAGMLSGFQMEAIFRLPGTIKKSTNLKKAEDGTLSISVDGPKLLAAMNKLFEDEEWLKGKIKAGTLDMNTFGGNALNEKLFGENAPIRAVVTGELIPLFDYKAEVAAAKKNYTAMLDKLGIKAVVQVASAKGQGFKSLVVGGVRLVKFSEQELGIRPFNYDKGYALSIVGQMSGSVLKFNSGMLEKAVADNGEDLMPSREWDRKISWPSLSKDKTTVVFDVKLKVPGKGVFGIKEISGTMEYIVAGEVKTVDLGINSFKKGAMGAKLGAEIKDIGENEWQEGYEMLKLKLALPSEAVKKVTFMDKNGEEIEVDQQGYSSSSGITTFNFSINGTFPAGATIKVEYYEDLKKYRIPFKIENVSLTGDPLR